MGATQTINATEFKAKCLGILDRLDSGELDRVIIIRRGQIVAVLIPPDHQASDVRNIYGFMRGSVTIADGVDLTEPVLDEPFDAELGIIHR